jgi:hypothetical protein
MVQSNCVEGPDDSLTRTGSSQHPSELCGLNNLEISSDEKTESQTVGTSEGEIGISHQRLTIIVIGLCLAIFLTALDQVRPSLITCVNVDYRIDSSSNNR